MSKYPLYRAHRERILDSFEEFLARQQERISRTLMAGELEREEERWLLHDWQGREGMELQEVRK